MIYADLKKDLYGDLIASLLFWKNMSGAMGSCVFKPNPYTSCAMNKTMDGKQCMIFWHMDDINILHAISNGVDGVLSQMTEKCVKVSVLSFSQGRVHNYLGMWLNYGTKCKVLINMPKHIESILEASAEDTDGIIETPASNHL